MKKVCQELINFFELEEGWDKNDLLYDFSKEILYENGTICSFDEVVISDGEKEIMVLEDFVYKLYDKIIKGVCNVIETA
ncbi:MAG: hypothetical protein PHC62_09620 [Candidatus Izemoplasmatales bacterium]|nr:hypothetical protein [Candidatus Izemoplasmatales bacterium]